MNYELIGYAVIDKRCSYSKEEERVQLPTGLNDVAVIGRNRGSDIAIRSPSVSGRHARIEVVGERKPERWEKGTTVPSYKIFDISKLAGEYSTDIPEGVRNERARKTCVKRGESLIVVDAQNDIGTALEPDDVIVLMAPREPFTEPLNYSPVALIRFEYRPPEKIPEGGTMAIRRR